MAGLEKAKAIAVHCPTSNMFLGSGLFPMEELKKNNVILGISTDVGGGTSYSMLQSLDAAYKIQQFLNYSIHPMFSFYWATLGNARALGLENEIGNFKSGCYADFVIIDTDKDLCSKTRMRSCSNLTEELFVLQTLGGMHCIKEVYVAGRKAK